MKTTFRLATPLSLGVALLCGCQSPLLPDEDGHTLRDTTITTIPVEQNSVTEVFWGGSH